MFEIILLVLIIFFMVLGVFYTSSIVCGFSFKKGKNKLFYIILPENSLNEMFYDAQLISRKIKNCKIIVLCEKTVIDFTANEQLNTNILYATYDTLPKIILHELTMNEDSYNGDAH